MLTAVKRCVLGGALAVAFGSAHAQNTDKHYSPAANATAQINRIHGTWESRAKRVRSARLEITVRDALTQALVNQDRDTLGIDFSWRDFGDSSRLAKTSVLRVSIERRKLRVESRSPDGQKLRFVQVFDGTNQKLLSFKDSKADHPRAFIMRQKDSDRFGPLWCSALTWFFTPFDEDARVDFSKLTLTNLHLSIDGSNCLILHNTDGRNEPRVLLRGNGKPYTAPSVQRDYWIDPAKGDTLRRYTLGTQNEDVEMQVDMDYRPDAKLGWMLQRWLAVRSNNGMLNQARLYEVQKLEISPSFERGEFDIPFPANTKISDDREHR